MPRGVPASGKRRPRQSPAGTAAGFEPAVPADTVDEFEAYVDTPEQPQTPQELAPADEELTVPFDVPAEFAAEPIELTPEQNRIKDLENQLALVSGKKDVEPEIDPIASPGDPGNIIIHFLEDGFSALGHVWFRGQELEFEPGGHAYKDTFDRLGRSWLDLRGDDFAQVERYGRVMFRSGPWPGKRYTDAVKVSFEKLKGQNGAPVSAPTQAELEKAEKAEARRKRSAPRLPAAI